MNRRVKRHLPTAISQQHGSPAEAEPALVICAQEAFQAIQGPKLYSKVLFEFLMHMTFDCFSLTLSNQLCGMRACKFFRTMLCRQVRLLTVV